jgi:hypothetical protein
MEQNRQPDESNEKTLLGDADEVEHPSIEEQLDEKLQEEESREEDEGAA